MAKLVIAFLTNYFLTARVLRRYRHFVGFSCLAIFSPFLLCPVTCPKPPLVSNADIHVGQLTHGSQASYTCKPGFQADNIARPITCQATGEWSSPTFRCVNMMGKWLLRHFRNAFVRTFSLFSCMIALSSNTNNNNNGDGRHTNTHTHMYSHSHYLLT